jgi:hypothetical protein
LRDEAAETLGAHLERTLDAARAAGPQVYSKKYAFVRWVYAFPA